MSKERLVELIDQCTIDYDMPSSEQIADYLLANGVVVPPCKVGDKLYIVTSVSEQIVECTIIGVWVCESNISVITDYGCIFNGSFGKTVFLTRSQAEAKVKESKSNDIKD